MANERAYDLLGQFLVFNQDVQQVLLSTGNVVISIFSNAEGTIIANDNNGNPLENRLIHYTEYRLPNPNGRVGGMKVYFGSGNWFEADDDNESAFWYSIQGLTPFAIKQFT